MDTGYKYFWEFLYWKKLYISISKLSNALFVSRQAFVYSSSLKWNMGSRLEDGGLYKLNQNSQFKYHTFKKWAQCYFWS